MFTFHSSIIIIVTHGHKSIRESRSNHPTVLSLKALNYDAYGLFRAAHSHNPAQYSHSVEYPSHFYAHIGAGPKFIRPLMSKLMWARTFCPWHHYITPLCNLRQPHRQRQCPQLLHPDWGLHRQHPERLPGSAHTSWRKVSVRSASVFPEQL